MRRTRFLLSWMLAALVVVTAGCEAPTRLSADPTVIDVRVDAVVTADGSVIMRTTYRVRDGRSVDLAIEAPDGGSIGGVRIDGDPLSGTSVAQISSGPGRHVIDAVLLGVVRRSGATATLTLPMWPAVGSMPLEARLVPVTAMVQLPVLPVPGSGSPLWLGVDSARAKTIDSPTPGVSVTGALSQSHAASLIVDLPAEAFPVVPASPSHAGSLREEHVRAAAVSADRSFWRSVNGARRRADLIAVGYWALVAVEAALPVLVALAMFVRTARSRRRAAHLAEAEVTEAPLNIPPDVLALLMAGGNEVPGGAVAAVLLALINGGDVEMEHVTSTDFRLRPRDGGVGRQHTGADAAVLGAVAQRGGEGGWASGPPLGLTLSDPWGRGFRRDVARRALAGRLLQRRLPSGLIMTSLVLLLATTSPLWIKSPETAFAAIVGAGAIHALARLGGFRLTRAGYECAARGRAFERFLRGQSELDQTGVPGVVVWGPNLVYAAATGYATTAIEAVVETKGSASASSGGRRGSDGQSVASGRFGAGRTAGLLLLAALIGCGAVSAVRAAGVSAADLPPLDCPVGSRTELHQRIVDEGARGVLKDLTNLECQDLHDLDLIQVDLTGADLRRANLSGTRLGQADLVGARLGEANLAGADLVQADMRAADLSDADLAGAKLGQAKLDGAVFQRVRARGADLGQASLVGADLRGADFTRAKFGQVTLTQADVSGAVLDYADLTQADLSKSDFSQAKLRHADVGVVDAQYAVFAGADLSDATWTSTLRSKGADLSGAVGLEGGLLDGSAVLKWVVASAGFVAVLLLLGLVVRRSRRLLRDAA